MPRLLSVMGWSDNTRSSLLEPLGIHASQSEPEPIHAPRPFWQTYACALPVAVGSPRR